MNLVRVGGVVTILKDIWNGGDGFFPDQHIGIPGEVVLVKEIRERTIIVRHHNVSPEQGFYLTNQEYRVERCCPMVKRPEPCWCVPVPIVNGRCTACGHLPECHQVQQ